MEMIDPLEGCYIVGRVIRPDEAEHAEPMFIKLHAPSLKVEFGDTDYKYESKSLYASPSVSMKYSIKLEMRDGGVLSVAPFPFEGHFPSTGLQL